MCPRCRGELARTDAGLACARCAVEWPVVDGVPWMTEEHARAWAG